MKKNLFLSLILLGTLGFAQTNCDNLKTENQSLKTENEYLKKVLEINTPIFETTKDDTSYKITSVSGKDNAVFITLLVETKKEDRMYTSGDIISVDLEGNVYKVDLYKSLNYYTKLIADVPVKVTYSFKDLQGKPLIIKAISFNTELSDASNLFSKKKATVTFKDLKVNWQ